MVLWWWCWQYGKDYDYDAPVKLLDKLLHAMSQTEEEQLVVVSQVLFLDSNLSSLVPQSDTLMLWWLAEWSGDDANISPQFLLLIIELQNHVSHQLTMQILVFFLRWRWCEIKLGTHSSGDYCNLQVLVADINIGYEDIVNTQVYIISVGWFTLHHLSHSYCNSFSLALTCEHGNF